MRQWSQGRAFGARDKKEKRRRPHEEDIWRTSVLLQLKPEEKRPPWGRKVEKGVANNEKSAQGVTHVQQLKNGFEAQEMEKRQRAAGWGADKVQQEKRDKKKCEPGPRAGYQRPRAAIRPHTKPKRGAVGL